MFVQLVTGRRPTTVAGIKCLHCVWFLLISRMDQEHSFHVFLFEKTLKLRRLRRSLPSSSTWTVFPKDFELVGAFFYGPDYLERIIEATSNTFRNDVIKSTIMLWQSDALPDKDVILYKYAMPVGVTWWNVSPREKTILPRVNIPSCYPHWHGIFVLLYRTNPICNLNKARSQMTGDSHIPR